MRKSHHRQETQETKGEMLFNRRGLERQPGNLRKHYKSGKKTGRKPNTDKDTERTLEKYSKQGLSSEEKTMRELGVHTT